MILDIKDYKDIFKKLYGSNSSELEKQYKRYQGLIKRHLECCAENDIHLFSTPGRTELSGNHTDHNRGRVLAASINLDSIAVVSKNSSGKVILYSEGYDKPFEVDLRRLQKVDDEKETTNALESGMLFYNSCKFIKIVLNYSFKSALI